MDQMPDALHADLEQLWKQIHTAGALIKTFAEQLRASRDATRKLEAQVAELRQQLHVRDEQLDALRADMEHIEELRKALRQAEGELDTARTTIDQLRRHLEHVEHQRADFEHAQQQTEQLHSELSSLQQLYAALTEDYRVAQEQLANAKSYEQERAELRARIAELEHEHLRSVAAHEELSYLREQVEQLQQEKADLRATLEQLQQRASHYDELERELENLRQQLDTATGALAEESQRRAADQKHIADLTERLRQAEATIAAAASDEHVAEWKAELERQLRAREQELAQIHEQHRALQEQLATVRAELDAQIQRNVELERQYAQHRTEHSADTLTDELVKLRRELELSERASAQRQEQLVELSNEIARLRKQILESQQHERSADQRIAEAIAPLEIKLEAAEQERKHLQVLLVSQRQRIHQLEDQLRLELERNIVLKRRIRQLEGQPTGSQIEQLLHQVQGMANTLNRIASQPSTGNEQLATVVSEVAALVERIEELLHARNQFVAQELREAIRQSRAALELYLKR